MSLAAHDFVKNTLYRELHSIFPSRLQYIRQGVNARQWLKCTNPLLSNLISENVGDDELWLQDSRIIKAPLRALMSDETFISKV